MSMVEAGSVTGKFFIPIGNIAFSATWQELKDFVRSVDGDPPINIDRVNIYVGRGCGFVSVLGKEDFERAYFTLNGAFFKGKYLQAWDGNRYNAISLLDNPFTTTPTQKTLVPEQLPPTPDWNQDAAKESVSQAGAYYTPSIPYNPITYPMSPPNSTTYAVSPHPISVSPSYSRNLTFSQHLPNQYNALPDPGHNLASASLSISTNDYSFQPRLPSLYHPTVSTGNTLNLRYPSAASPKSQPQPQYIALSQRSLFINHVPKAASAVQIRALIVDKLFKSKLRFSHQRSDTDAQNEYEDDDDGDGIWSEQESADDLIEDLQLPLHSDGKRRGHATLKLRREAVAEVIMKELDGFAWKGERLSVRWDKLQPAAETMMCSSSLPKSKGKDEKAGKDGKGKSSSVGSVSAKRDALMSPAVVDSGSWKQSMSIRTAGKSSASSTGNKSSGLNGASKTISSSSGSKTKSGSGHGGARKEIGGGGASSRSSRKESGGSRREGEGGMPASSYEASGKGEKDKRKIETAKAQRSWF